MDKYFIYMSMTDVDELDSELSKFPLSELEDELSSLYCSLEHRFSEFKLIDDISSIDFINHKRFIRALYLNIAKIKAEIELRKLRGTVL